VPPLTQARLPGGALEALPALHADGGYAYVLFHVGPLHATRRGVALAASASAVTFSLLHSAHLCLCTTTPEALAAGLSWLLAPARALPPLRRAADEAVLTLLLAMRFCALVFEQGRNLALGLAMRGVDWGALGPLGTLDTLLALTGRLLGDLFATAALVADAMRARGYVGPQQAQAALQARARRAARAYMRCACVAVT
jgi:general transcription factor 3C polypeptide 2